MSSDVPESLRPRSIKRQRCATSTLEVIVALTLLLSVLSLSVSLISRHGRLLTSQRHYRQALDELSNQMDRITSIPVDQVPELLKQLSVSSFAASHLSAAKLKGELHPSDIGQRITLLLTWNDGHEQSAAMTGWTMPGASGPGEQKLR